MEEFNLNGIMNSNCDLITCDQKYGECLSESGCSAASDLDGEFQKCYEILKLDNNINVQCPGSKLNHHNSKSLLSVINTPVKSTVDLEVDFASAVKNTNYPEDNMKVLDVSFTPNCLEKESFISAQQVVDVDVTNERLVNSVSKPNNQFLFNSAPLDFITYESDNSQNNINCLNDKSSLRNQTISSCDHFLFDKKEQIILQKNQLKINNFYQKSQSKLKLDSYKCNPTSLVFGLKKIESLRDLSHKSLPDINVMNDINFVSTQNLNIKTKDCNTNSNNFKPPPEEHFESLSKQLPLYQNNLVNHNTTEIINHSIGGKLQTMLEMNNTNENEDKNKVDSSSENHEDTSKSNFNNPLHDELSSKSSNQPVSMPELNLKCNTHQNKRIKLDAKLSNLKNIFNIEENSQNELKVIKDPLVLESNHMENTSYESPNIKGSKFVDATRSLPVCATKFSTPISKDVKQKLELKLDNDLFKSSTLKQNIVPDNLTHDEIKINFKANVDDIITIDLKKDNSIVNNDTHLLKSVNFNENVLPDNFKHNPATSSTKQNAAKIIIIDLESDDSSDLDSEINKCNNVLTNTAENVVILCHEDDTDLLFENADGLKSNTFRDNVINSDGEKSPYIGEKETNLDISFKFGDIKRIQNCPMASVSLNMKQEVSEHSCDKKSISNCLSKESNTSPNLLSLNQDLICGENKKDKKPLNLTAYGNEDTNLKIIESGNIISYEEVPETKNNIIIKETDKIIEMPATSKKISPKNATKAGCGRIFKLAMQSINVENCKNSSLTNNEFITLKQDKTNSGNEISIKNEPKNNEAVENYQKTNEVVKVYPNKTSNDSSSRKVIKHTSKSNEIEESYLEDEKDDLTNPEWQAVKNLSTNLERYQQVRKCWGSQRIPNPKKNLTYSSYRRRLIGFETKIVKQHKRQASTNLNGKMAKRLCTYFLDQEIKNVKKAKDEEKQEILNYKNNEINYIDEQRVQRQREMQDYYGYAGTSMRYENLRFDSRVSEINYSCKQMTDSCETSYGRKINALRQRQKEVLKFYEFYKGSKHEDPTQLTDTQFQELTEIEDIYRQFDLHYKK